MSLAKLLNPRVCELGKIKIGGLGEKKTSRSGGEYRVPVKYDHFVITTLNRDSNGLLVRDDALMAALEHDADGKIRSLPVSLLSNDVEEVLQAAYLWFNGKRLAGRSDGESLTLHFDPKTRAWLDKPVTVPWGPEWAQLVVNGAPAFKLHCTMSVVLAAQAARFGGLYKFRTTSQITSEQLYGSLVQLRQLTGGVLRGLPLRLVVRPMQVCPGGQPTTIYVVHVELQGADVAAIQAKALELARFEVQHVKQLAAVQNEYRQLLRAPDEFHDDDEEAEVAQEFAPHQQPGQLPVGEVKAEPQPEKHDPKAALADKYAGRIDAVRALAELESLVGNINTDVKAGLLGKAETERLAPLVINRKKQLAETQQQPAPQQPETFPLTGDAEGEEGPDPTAPAANAPSAAASNASASASPAAPAPAASDPAPKDAPAAERRTAAPKTIGDELADVIALCHELGVSWVEIRDRVEGKGREIAAAIRLTCNAKTRIGDLTPATRAELTAELERRVAAKRQNAAKRAAGVERNKVEAAAAENCGSAS